MSSAAPGEVAAPALRRWIPVPIAVAVLLLVVPYAFWNERKYVIGGDDSLLYYVYPLRMLQHYALNVASDNNLSVVGAYGQQLYLAPFLGLLALTKLLLPGMNTQLLWYGLNLSGGFLAMYALLGELLATRTASGAAPRAVATRTVCSLAYTLSVFSYFTVWSTQLFPLYLVVIFPLVSLLVLRSVRLRSPAQLVGAALVLALFSIVILSTPWLLAMCIAAASPLLWALWPHRRRALLYFAFFVVLTLLLNAHWIVHLVNASLTPSAKLRPTTATLFFGSGDERLVREVSATNALLYPMLQLFHIGLLERFRSPNWPIYSGWSTRFLVPNAVMFALLPLAGARATAAATSARSLFVATGFSWVITLFLFTAQAGAWGQSLFVSLSRGVPGFVMFRNMYDKFGLALAFSSALFLFAALQVLVNRERPGKRVATSRGALMLAISLLIVVEAVPFLAGRYYDHPFYSTTNTFNTVGELNGDFRALAQWLAGSTETGRYAWLPLNAANYVQIEDEHEPNHVYNGVSPLLFLSRKNDLPGQLSFGSSGAPLVDAVLARNWPAVGEIFQRFNVEFVIINNKVSSDLQHSYLYGARANRDLYDAQQDPELAATLLGPKLSDFGSRYSLYQIHERFQSDRVSVIPAGLAEERSARARFVKRAPHLYDVKLERVTAGDRLRFLEPFNPQWEVVTGDDAVPLSHHVALEYANEWELDLPRLRRHLPPSAVVEHEDGSFDIAVQLRFRGQRLFRPAVTTSAVTAAGCVAALSGSAGLLLVRSRPSRSVPRHQRSTGKDRRMALRRPR